MPTLDRQTGGESSSITPYLVNHDAAIARKTGALGFGARSPGTRPGAPRLLPIAAPNPRHPAGVRLTLVRRIGASAVLMMTLVLTAPAEAAGGIAVSPHSGRSGTRFVVSFVAPRPEPARGYHVRLRAANTQEEGCVATIDFYNPKAVRAGLRVEFRLHDAGQRRTLHRHLEGVRSRSPLRGERAFRWQVHPELRGRPRSWGELPSARCSTSAPT